MSVLILIPVVFETPRRVSFRWPRPFFIALTRRFITASRMSSKFLDHALNVAESRSFHSARYFATPIIVSLRDIYSEIAF